MVSCQPAAATETRSLFPFFLPATELLSRRPFVRFWTFLKSFVTLLHGALFPFLRGSPPPNSFKVFCLLDQCLLQTNNCCLSVFTQEVCPIVLSPPSEQAGLGVLGTSCTGFAFLHATPPHHFLSTFLRSLRAGSVLPLAMSP